MIRVIALILLLFFAFRFLGRLLMPLMRQQRSQSGGATRSRAEQRPEGEVRIEYTDAEKARRAKQKSKDSTEGEYVDFEELD